MPVAPEGSTRVPLVGKIFGPAKPLRSRVAIDGPSDKPPRAITAGLAASCKLASSSVLSSQARYNGTGTIVSRITNAGARSFRGENHGDLRRGYPAPAEGCDQSRFSPYSTPGAWWAGYAWPRRTSGRSRKPGG